MKLKSEIEWTRDEMSAPPFEGDGTVGRVGNINLFEGWAVANHRHVLNEGKPGLFSLRQKGHEDCSYPAYNLKDSHQLHIEESNPSRPDEQHTESE